ncbi:hypothetical protein CDL12_08599 [Handroanthus impetiginosus]|uniref:Uncharacterized protein n=1 Tax=Handroanthus impetiginosus TaxID=429701 RepID=A0A2G9HMH2_9LAMI|nr:hypothetical protein CDL12_08599 [Handroanthus impetiginosus]
MNHVAIDFHFVCEQAQNKEIEVKHLNAADQVADILMKPHSRATFNQVFNKLGVVDVTLNLLKCKREGDKSKLV